jgi:hypothetical protein
LADAVAALESLIKNASDDPADLVAEEQCPSRCRACGDFHLTTIPGRS